jgi:predicted amidohydrolase YtcJ
MTLGAAYTRGQDREIGSLEIGKLADLIVLDRSVFQIPPKEIPFTRVLMTVVGERRSSNNRERFADDPDARCSHRA